jgi:hypothetical protein
MYEHNTLIQLQFKKHIWSCPRKKAKEKLLFFVLQFLVTKLTQSKQTEEDFKNKEYYPRENSVRN